MRETTGCRPVPDTDSGGGLAGAVCVIYNNEEGDQVP